ncbi:MAG: undecaprenyl-diphosphatase [Hyphomicrobiales bacterium]|nr:undecaprenyl-diphosphatase [Hyphomicrobiales bacterium]
MTLPDALKAIFLGGIEGLTEFLPVSSTGHLLLVGHFLGFESKGKSFEVLIQLGAILAILLVYARKIIAITLGLRTDPRARHFVLAVLLAFLPAAVIGALAHSIIKSYLFDPLIVCTTLIAGGLVLLAVGDLASKPRYEDAMDLPLGTAFKIGLFQCLAMVPGVSRSGATIVSAMLMGTDKRAAAEFSFFLAIPTMTGAFSYDLYKNYKLLDFDDSMLIVLGFVAAFLMALLVVRGFLQFVGKHGFGLFAWWRIIVGVLGLAGLYFRG